MTDMNAHPRITHSISVVVIGGGYAGAVAANRLQQRRDVTVSLVNPRPHFVERIRLHQLVADSGSATVDYADMLHPTVHLVVDTATEIDANSRTVRLASGSGLRYDYLIYAVGSTSARPTVPGAHEYAWQISDFEHARRLRDRIDALALDAPVCVVGGGLTGIETAAELAEQRPSGDTDQRPDAGAVAERSRTAIGGPPARPPRGAGPARHRHRGAAGRGGAVRRDRGAERGDESGPLDSASRTWRRAAA